MKTLKNEYPDYDISSNSTDKFKMLRKIDKESLEKKLRENDLFKTLLYWIGKDTITISMTHDIKDLLSTSKYNVYILWGKALSTRETYKEILCERFVTSCAFIFESEKDIRAISLMCSVNFKIKIIKINKIIFLCK